MASKIKSLNVSAFTYKDYCYLFELYGNDGANVELRRIIDNLGFNLDRKDCLTAKDKWKKIFEEPRTVFYSEMDYHAKHAMKISNLALWTVSKEDELTFEKQMSQLFIHALKVDYKVQNFMDIRRIYTMSRKIKTVQMVEFILLDQKWYYFDYYKLRAFINVKDQIQAASALYIKDKKMFFSKEEVCLYLIISNTYADAIDEIYDFYLQDDFEDDNSMWDHELFQPGLHFLHF